jgi:hypothetical protein
MRYTEVQRQIALKLYDEIRVCPPHPVVKEPVKKSL